MANVPVITEPDWDGKTPYSRSEAILLSIINGTPIDTEKWEGIPLSRGEYLLLQLKDVIEDNSMLDFKGRVDSVADLPSTGNKKGDVYTVGPESQLNRPEYFWTGTSWEYFGQIVDLSGYATLQEVQTAINAAVNSLTAMVEGTYLPLTGGIIRDSDQAPDSTGKILFKVGNDMMGSIGKSGTAGKLSFESFGKSLAITNTGSSLDITSIAGPVNVGTSNTNAPVNIKSNNVELIKLTSPTSLQLTTANSHAYQVFDDTNIFLTANGDIQFVTAGDNQSPFIKMHNNSTDGRSISVGIGNTEAINLQSNGAHFHRPIYVDSVLSLGSAMLSTAGGNISGNAQTGITFSGSAFNISTSTMKFNGGTAVFQCQSITHNNNPVLPTVLLTQAEYDALETKDPNVVYNIYEPDEEEGE